MSLLSEKHTSMTESIYYYQSSVGCLALIANDKSLIRLQFISHQLQKNSCQSDILLKICFQLDEYFAGKRKVFDIPIDPQGTLFQQKVWKALLRIPFGNTISYTQLAQAINHPKAYRAVGTATGKNPIAIIIPCHRVINSNGQLGGYTFGLDVKRHLLNLEQINITPSPQP